MCCESLAPATRCLALRLVEHELSKIRGAHLLTTHGSGYVGGLGRIHGGRIHGGRIRGLGRIHGGRVGGLGCIRGRRIGRLGRIRGRRIGRLGRIRGRRVGRLCIIFPSPSPSPSPSPIPSAILVLVLSKKILNSGHTRPNTIRHSLTHSLEKSASSHSSYIPYFYWRAK